LLVLIKLDTRLERLFVITLNFCLKLCKFIVPTQSELLAQLAIILGILVFTRLA
jgi:hypothetical protein